MASHVGVDWASGTWVVVEATEDTIEVGTEPSLLNVWREYADRATEILVDVPVHLESNGTRRCDSEAKEYLKPRGSTVFWTPTKGAIAAESYDDAEAANDRGLGSHSWGLIPQIREVNALLGESDGAREMIYESHPEVCFKAFCGEALPSKKTLEGFSNRKDCLLKHDEDAFQPVVDLVDERQENSQWFHRRSSR